jgi:hypothetical protein
MYASDNPLRTGVVYLVANQVVYFTGKALNGKWKILALILGTYVGNLVAAFMNSLLGILPFALSLPADMLKATTVAIMCILIGIPVLPLLRRLGYINGKS